MKLKLMLLNVGILSLLVTGCGKNLNGNYTGIDQVTQTATGTTGSYVPSTGANQSSSMTMALTQNGESVTGTWNDAQSGLSGSIQGTMSGGSLGSIIMMSSGTTGTTGYSSYGSSYLTGCTFTGSLNIGDNNMISGSLGATGSSSSYGGVSQCTGVTRTLQLNQNGS